MNLESTEYGDNKGYCEDLTEGKFSFPVVHAVRASEDDRQILSGCIEPFSSRETMLTLLFYIRHPTEEDAGQCPQSACSPNYARAYRVVSVYPAGSTSATGAGSNRDSEARGKRAVGQDCQGLGGSAGDRR